MNLKFLIFLALAIPMSLRAQTGMVRKYSNEFLAIGASARGMGMANTITSSVDDLTAGYYNPAGLAKMDHPFQLGFLHSEYFAGITNFDYGALAFKLDRSSALSISLLRFGADNIPNTYDLIDKNGVINYSKVTDFSVADYGFLISYGRMHNDRASYHEKNLRYGGSLKIIRRTVGPFGSSWGFGIDAGAQLDLNDHSTVSLVVRDATTTFNAWTFTFTDEQKQVLANTGNDIPTHSTELTMPRIILGINRKFDFTKDFFLLGEGGLDITTDGKRNVLIASNPISADPHIGVEAGYKKIVYLRTGIGGFQFYTNDDPDKSKVVGFQPSVGIGLRLKKLMINYAFTNFGSVTPGLYSHIIDLRLSLDRRRY